MSSLAYKKFFFAVLTISLFGSWGLSKEHFFAPTHPQENAALFVALHGCMDDAQVMEKQTRLSEFAEKHGFYVFYPEKPNTENSYGCFDFYNEDSQRPGAGDAAIIVEKINSLLQNHAIDPNRVYLVGMSAGASLISVLTSCYPDLFAGAALHSGMGYGHASNWQESLMLAATGPLPGRARNLSCLPTNYRGKIFLVQGSLDTVMSPRHFSRLKKDYLQGASKLIQRVRKGKTNLAYKQELHRRNGKDIGRTLYIHGLDHTWSGSKPKNTAAPTGPDVTRMIVDFFLQEEDL